MLILIVASGPDRGRVYELHEGNAVVLGREGDQVKLSDRKASREHAVLWYEAGQWYIQDKQSRHGTYRNQTRLTGASPVNSGDRIQVGETLLVMAKIHDSGSIDVEGGGVAAAVATHAEPGATPLPMGRRRTSPWVFAAATFAAVAFLAMVIAMMAASRRDAQQVIAATQDAAHDAVERSMPRLLAAIEQSDATADPAATTATDALLRDVLARIDESRQEEAELATAQGQQALRDEVRQMIHALDARTTPGADETRLATLLPRLEAAMDRLEAAEGDDALQQNVQQAMAEAKASRELIEAMRTQLASIVEAQAAMPARSQAEVAAAGEALTAVHDLQTKLDELAAAQPSSRQLAEAMQAAVKSAPTTDVSGLEASLARVLERLDATPDAEAIVAALAEADLPQLEPSRELTRRAVAAIEGQAALREQMAKLESAVREATANGGRDSQIEAQVMAAVAERFDKLETRLVEEDAKLAAALEGLRQASTQRGEVTADFTGVETKLAKLLERPAMTPEQVAAAMERVSRSEGLEQSLARVDEAVRALAEREQPGAVDTQALASAVRASVAELLAEQPGDDEADAKLAQKLDAALAKLDKVAGSEDVARQREAFDAALGEVKVQLAAVADRPALGSDAVAAAVDLTPVQESLAALSERVQALSERDTPDALLKEAREALAARKKADAKLAELMIVLEAEPKRQEAMLQRVLAAVEAQEQSDAAGEGAMQRTLERLRAETAGQMAALREAVQGMTGGGSSTGGPLAAGRGVTRGDERLWSAGGEGGQGVAGRRLPWATSDAGRASGEGNGSSWSPASIQPGLSSEEWAQGALAATGGGAGNGMGGGGPMRPRAAGEGGEGGDGGGTEWRWGDPMAMPAEDAPRAPDAPRPDPLQEQYRRAWETGKAVQIGGSVDPTTGEVTQGRTLDPAEARAGDFADWRDWYKADQYRERLWLEDKAREWREQNPAGEPLFDLPASPGGAG